MLLNGDPPAMPSRWRITIEWSEDPEDGLPALDDVLIPIMAVITALAIPGVVVRPEALD